MRLPVALLAAVFVCACANAAPESHAIVVSEGAERFELTVPRSNLVMAFPKGQFRHAPVNVGGGTANPRYFQFHDREAGTIVSGWFEPESRYQPLDPTLESESAGLKRFGAWPPQSLEQGTIGPMKTVTYFLPLPNGATNFHIRASYVGAGTWVDLHGSVTTRDPPAEAKARLQALFETIEFRQR